MSATLPETIGPASRRTSRLALAALLCGLVTPVVGLVVLADTGSDMSDLLTLTFLPLLVAALVLCFQAHRSVWKAPERLAGTGYAKAGALLAVMTVCAAFFLITAT